MKGAGAIVVGVGLLLAGVAWWAVQSARSTPMLSAERPPNAAPAAYPADMWTELARVPAMRVVQGKPEELPPDSAWGTGEPQPLIGSPEAERGGTLRLSAAGPFPANLLPFGSPTPQFFRANAFTRTELPLVARHPVTHCPIPGTAEAWAVRGRSVYFRLHPKARYTNGRPVRAADYALGALLRAKTHDAEWEDLTAAAEELRVYDERTLSLTLRTGGALEVLRASALLHAAEPGFYEEFAGDYTKRYAWRSPPNTGAYAVGYVLPGQLIELRRVPHWWAEELPLYRRTCNPSFVQFRFLTDETQAFELLLRGELDLVQTRNLTALHQYAGSPGTVLSEFTATGPPPLYGIALNARRISLPVRRGLLHAMDMDRAVALLFHGEGERLRSFFTGYGSISPPPSPPPAYDPSLARAAFAQAGFTIAGEDGILRRADGTPLRVHLAYVPSRKVSTLAEVLRESARTCGVDLVPSPLPWQSCARLVRDGEHELTFWATVPASPLPAPARYFHSSASGDEAPFGLRDSRMDAALAAYASAPDSVSLAGALARVDALVRELAVWLPGWRESRAHVLHSPRVRIPASPGYYVDAVDNHTIWLAP